MEHQQAIAMHAAEKYVLGELPGEWREQFEEHFFDCGECALDVRTTAAFVAASKEIFQEQPEAELARAGRGQSAPPSPWAKWLKTLIAIPAMAALVVMFGYEARQIAKKNSGSGTTEEALVASAEFGLRGGDRDVNQSVTVRVHSADAFGLHFDFTPSQRFETYVGEVQDQTGRALMKLGIPAERINKEVKFVVAPGRLAPGKYILMIYGDGAEAGRETKVSVAKFAFAVEITP
jgi:hypothetical protein